MKNDQIRNNPDLDSTVRFLNKFISRFDILDWATEQQLIEYIQGKKLNNLFFLELIGNRLDIIKLQAPENSSLIVKAGYRLINFALNLFYYPVRLIYSLSKFNKYPEYWEKIPEYLNYFKDATQAIPKLKNIGEDKLFLAEILGNVDFDKISEKNKKALDIICAELKSKSEVSSPADKLNNDLVLGIFDLIKNPENIKIISLEIREALITEYYRNNDGVGIFNLLEELTRKLDKQLHADVGLITALQNNKTAFITQMDTFYKSDDEKWKWMRDRKLSPEIMDKFFPMLDDFGLIADVIHGINTSDIFGYLGRIASKVQTLPKLRKEFADPNSNVQQLTRELVVGILRNSEYVDKELFPVYGMDYKMLEIIDIFLQDLDFTEKLLTAINDKNYSEASKIFLSVGSPTREKLHDFMVQDDNASMLFRIIHSPGVKSILKNQGLERLSNLSSNENIFKLTLKTALAFSVTSAQLIDYVNPANYRIPIDYAQELTDKFNEYQKNFPDKVVHLDSVLKQISRDKLAEPQYDLRWKEINTFIERQTLDCTEFTKLNLKHCVINDFTFVNTNFTQSPMIGSDIKNCLFINGNLSRVMFNRANIQDTTFENCKFGPGVQVTPNWNPLSWFSSSNSQQQNLSFREVSLENVSFKNSNFTAENITFQNAQLINVDFTGAVTKDKIDFTGAVLDDKTLASIKNNPEFYKLCNLENIRMNGQPKYIF